MILPPESPQEPPLRHSPVPEPELSMERWKIEEAWTGYSEGS